MIQPPTSDCETSIQTADVNKSQLGQSVTPYISSAYRAWLELPHNFFLPYNLLVYFSSACCYFRKYPFQCLVLSSALKKGQNISIPIKIHFELRDLSYRHKIFWLLKDLEVRRSWSNLCKWDKLHVHIPIPIPWPSLGLNWQKLGINNLNHKNHIPVSMILLYVNKITDHFSHDPYPHTNTTRSLPIIVVIGFPTNHSPPSTST